MQATLDSAPDLRRWGQEDMILTELVHYFRNEGSFEDFCHQQSLDLNSEVIGVFAQVPLSIQSPLGFFEIEKTEGRIAYSHDNVEYRNLFDFFFFLDAIEESKVEPNRSSRDSEIAEKLLSYAINDA